MSLKFGRIQPWTAELAALDQFKKLLLENYSKYFDDLLSGERSLASGLLVKNYSHKILEFHPLNIFKEKMSKLARQMLRILNYLLVLIND